MKMEKNPIDRRNVKFLAKECKRRTKSSYIKHSEKVSTLATEFISGKLVFEAQLKSIRAVSTTRRFSNQHLVFRNGGNIDQTNIRTVSKESRRLKRVIDGGSSLWAYALYALRLSIEHRTQNIDESINKWINEKCTYTEMKNGYLAVLLAAY